MSQVKGTVLLKTILASDTAEGWSPGHPQFWPATYKFRGSRHPLSFNNSLESLTELIKALYSWLPFYFNRGIPIRNKKKWRRVLQGLGGSKCEASGCPPPEIVKVLLPSGDGNSIANQEYSNQGSALEPWVSRVLIWAQSLHGWPLVFSSSGGQKLYSAF